MKFKYFLRGLGTGIIFTAVICLVAFQNTDFKSIPDKEVIERAKDLGMVVKEDSVKDMFSAESTMEQTTEELSKATTEEEMIANKTSEEAITEETTAEEVTTKEKTTEKKTTEKKTTEKRTTEEKTTEVMTEKKTTETTTEEKTNKKEKVTITIRGGMSSYPVCQMLQEAGVVDDAADFDNYLIKNGYANRISVGTHTLMIGMTYKEIAVAISDPE